MSSAWLTPIKKTDARLQDQAEIFFVKERFRDHLIHALHLHRVSGPLIVDSDSGIQDNLNGSERGVSFGISAMNGRRFEVVHSLAKWKRLALKRFGVPSGHGICVDMQALRPQEDCLESSIHSVYVDQWDWEKTLASSDERNIHVLKQTVRQIYSALKAAEEDVASRFGIAPQLPPNIQFIHAQDLARGFPDLNPKQREHVICRAYGAVFVMGIGGPLSDGVPHDGRAPDYDDWSTVATDGNPGLNGDILVWNDTLGDAFELSSMGIRVDKAALVHQLKVCHATDRMQLPWHQMLLNDELPPSIGGGIGQSRLCMLLLQKSHIGQVQPSVWPSSVHARCQEEGVSLL